MSSKSALDIIKVSPAELARYACVLKNGQSMAFFLKYDEPYCGEKYSLLKHWSISNNYVFCDTAGTEIITFNSVGEFYKNITAYLTAHKLDSVYMYRYQIDMLQSQEDALQSDAIEIMLRIRDI